MRHFIITIDTEGDNLWEYHNGDVVATNNSLFIPRFQKICEQYGLKPVYLTNYEMILSQDFTTFVKPKVNDGLCEVGIHVHAWNNPPMYELANRKNDCSYLIEYPNDIMRQKFELTYNLIRDKIGTAPISHRAGRWAMNDDYFKLLLEYGIKVDCSHVPGVNMHDSWGANISGPDYSTVSSKPSMINGIFEVPVTIQKLHHCSMGSLRHRVKTMIIGDKVWIRPSTHSSRCINKVLDIISKNEEIDYVIFMMHSSEFMPGGSPFFRDEHSIETLYQELNRIFSHAINLGYCGTMLCEYYDLIRK